MPFLFLFKWNSADIFDFPESVLRFLSEDTVLIEDLVRILKPEVHVHYPLCLALGEESLVPHVAEEHGFAVRLAVILIAVAAVSLIDVMTLREGAILPDGHFIQEGFDAVCAPVQLLDRLPASAALRKCSSGLNSSAMF